MSVVVVDEFAEHFLELATVEDEHPVEALPTDSADKTLGEGVGPWRSDRRANDPYAVCMEDLVEAGRELGVSVTDEEPDRAGLFGQDDAQIAGLLDHPLSNGAGRDSRHVDPSGVQLDEEEHVEAPKNDGIDGEEVTRQHRGRLSSEELGPRWTSVS